MYLEVIYIQKVLNTRTQKIPSEKIRQCTEGI